MSRPDPRDRDLTADETRARDQLHRGLTAARRYLNLTAGDAAGTLPDGRARRVPVRPRRRTPDPDDPWTAMGLTELYVHPGAARALLAARAPDAVRGVEVGEIREALLFMGAARAVTLRGRDEHDRASPWRAPAGWLRLSREMVARVYFANFVPSLAGLPGRATLAPGRLSPRMLARAEATRVAPSAAAGAVAVLLRRAEPTVLWAVATGQGRPLVPRRRGRQPRRDVRFATGWALLPVPAVHRFLADAGPELGVSGLATAAATGVLLGEVAELYPDRFRLVEHVRAPDRRGSARSSWRWLRCDLAAMGLPFYDPVGLRAEFVAFRDAYVAAGLERPGEGGALPSARSVADMDVSQRAAWSLADRDRAEEQFR